jgi:hypothetical protein
MAYGAACHKNLLQVSLALNMYAQDWDGRLPPSSHWMDRAHSYTRTWSVLRCPAIGDKEPTHFGYAFNDRLAGRSIEKFKRPETIFQRARKPTGDERELPAVGLALEAVARCRRRNLPAASRVHRCR